MSAPTPHPQPDAELLEPIAGVSLEMYARVVRGTGAYNFDSSMLPTLAGQFGIGDDAWHQAHVGWNDRIRSDPGVAHRFTAVYHGR